MRLLSYNMGQGLFNNEEYEDFGNFKLFITKRSWVGKTYVGPKDGEDFLKELKESKDFFSSLKTQGFTHSSSGISFVIDSSVFKGKEEFSASLIELLEEIDDLDDGMINNANNIEMKYWKKLKMFADKLEYHPYLFRWHLNNKTHPFAERLKKHLLDVVHARASKIPKMILKELKGIAMEQTKLSLKKLQGDKVAVAEEINNKFDAYKIKEKAMLTLKNETQKYLLALFKYTWSESSLFFATVHCVNLYFSILEEKMVTEISAENAFTNTRILISITRTQYKNELFFNLISDGLAFPVDLTEHESYKEFKGCTFDDLIIDCQTHVHSYFKEIQRTGAAPFLLTLIKEENNQEDILEIGVLKEIVKWACRRIKKQISLNKLTTWSHTVTSQYFFDIGIKEMRFLDQSTIDGPEGEELSLLVSILFRNEQTEELLRMYFPLLGADYWEDLNVYQCAVIAYAVCLYHDYLYTEHQITPKTPPEDKEEDLGAQYSLVFKKESLAKKSVSKREGTNRKGSKRKSHWVSFHFRKQHVDFVAGEVVRKTASKYGFENIPRGYTFVDAFLKGDAENGAEMLSSDISAIDVLSKTLQKAKQMERIIQ